MGLARRGGSLRAKVGADATASKAQRSKAPRSSSERAEWFLFEIAHDSLFTAPAAQRYVSAWDDESELQGCRSRSRSRVAGAYGVKKKGHRLPGLRAPEGSGEKTEGNVRKMDNQSCCHIRKDFNRTLMEKGALRSGPDALASSVRPAAVPLGRRTWRSISRTNNRAGLPWHSHTKPPPVTR